MRKPGPNVLTRLDEHARDLGVVGQEMLDQVQAKGFQGLNRVLASQGVNRVFHGVGWEDLAIVALNMRGLKVTFKAYSQSDLADVVAARPAGEAPETDSRTPRAGFNAPHRHT